MGGALPIVADIARCRVRLPTVVAVIIAVFAIFYGKSLHTAVHQGDSIWQKTHIERGVVDNQVDTGYRRHLRQYVLQRRRSWVLCHSAGPLPAAYGAEGESGY